MELFVACLILNASQLMSVSNGKSVQAYILRCVDVDSLLTWLQSSRLRQDNHAGLSSKVFTTSALQRDIRSECPHNSGQRGMGSN